MYDDEIDHEKRTPYWSTKDAALALANGLDDIKRLEQQSRDYYYYNPYCEDEKAKVADTIANAIRYLYDNASRTEGTIN